MPASPIVLHTAYLSLGSNLGDKSLNLQTAIRHIAETIGQVTAVSSFFTFEPWGYESEHVFLNAAMEVKTALKPLQVLKYTKNIEISIGRSEKSSIGVYKDRLIDIDLIMYDDRVFSSDELILPHPLFHERVFVLEPLCEIAPDLIHPLLKKTIREVLSKK